MVEQQSTLENGAAHKPTTTCLYRARTLFYTGSTLAIRGSRLYFFDGLWSAAERVRALQLGMRQKNIRQFGRLCARDMDRSRTIQYRRRYSRAIFRAPHRFILLCNTVSKDANHEFT